MWIACNDDDCIFCIVGFEYSIMMMVMTILLTRLRFLTGLTNYTGLILPTGWQRTSRLASAMSWKYLPPSSFPSSVHVPVSPLYWSTCNARYDQKTSSTQYLISSVWSWPMIILSTGNNHLLVQASSFETSHRPGKNLLCTEQHFERFIHRGAFAQELSWWFWWWLLWLFILQLDDGFNTYHKCCPGCNSSDILSFEADYNNDICNDTGEGFLLMSIFHLMPRIFRCS